MSLENVLKSRRQNELVLEKFSANGSTDHTIDDLTSAVKATAIKSPSDEPKFLEMPGLKKDISKVCMDNPIMNGSSATGEDHVHHYDTINDLSSAVKPAVIELPTDESSSFGSQKQDSGLEMKSVATRAHSPLPPVPDPEIENRENVVQNIYHATPVQSRKFIGNQEANDGKGNNDLKSDSPSYHNGMESIYIIKGSLVEDDEAKE